MTGWLGANRVPDVGAQGCVEAASIGSVRTLGEHDALSENRNVERSNACVESGVACRDSAARRPTTRGRRRESRRALSISAFCRRERPSGRHCRRYAGPACSDRRSSRPVSCARNECSAALPTARIVPRNSSEVTSTSWSASVGRDTRRTRDVSFNVVYKSRPPPNKPVKLNVAEHSCKRHAERGSGDRRRGAFNADHLFTPEGGRKPVART